MFDSLIEWCTVPVKRVKSNGYKVNGEPDMVAIATVYGYVVEENTNIIDATGHEVLSSTQIYLLPDTVIDPADLIMFADGAYPIKKIRNFYDGNTGLSSIKVVYL